MSREKYIILYRGRLIIDYDTYLLSGFVLCLIIIVSSLQVDNGMISITYCNCYVTLFGMDIAILFINSNLKGNNNG